jgi:hypothetical protein
MALNIIRAKHIHGGRFVDSRLPRFALLKEA